MENDTTIQLPVEKKSVYKKDKICCGLDSFTFGCIKVFMCMVLSFISVSFGMYLLIDDKFKTVAISAFATSLITNTIMFWLDSPKIKNSESKPS